MDIDDHVHLLWLRSQLFRDYCLEYLVIRIVSVQISHKNALKNVFIDKIGDWLHDGSCFSFVMIVC